MTDIRAYGYKKRHLPKLVTVIGASFILASVNTLFYNTSNQYVIYIALLFLIGTIYTIFFIDAHVIYSISLQLELICCYLVLKIICQFLVLFCVGEPSASVLNTIIFYVIFAIGLALCSYFFSSFTLKAPFEQPYKYFITITFIPLILLIFAYLLIYIGGDENADASEKLLALLMNVLIMALLISSHYLSFLHISSYNELIESRAINQHMELLQSHVERSSALVEQIRRDKHEMKNVYFYINSLLESGDYDELTDFVQTKLLHRYDRLEEFHTGNKLIDYLLSQKACEAMDAGISFLADIRLPEHLTMENIDLCSLLQNLLDNAIDASKKEEKKDIQIKIAQQKNYLVIAVKNRSSVDVVKTNPKLLSTKPDKAYHGIGTRVIRKIVDKYDGAMDISMDSGYFVVSIMLAAVD
jgi:sensor histidine kinase YesM